MLGLVVAGPQQYVSKPISRSMLPYGGCHLRCQGSGAQTQLVCLLGASFSIVYEIAPLGSNGAALFSARQPVLLYRLVAMAYVRARNIAALMA